MKRKLSNFVLRIFSYIAENTFLFQTYFIIAKGFLKTGLCLFTNILHLIPKMLFWDFLRVIFLQFWPFVTAFLYLITFEIVGQKFTLPSLKKWIPLGLIFLFVRRIDNNSNNNNNILVLLLQVSWKWC